MRCKLVPQPSGGAVCAITVTGEVHPYDPRVFELLHDLTTSLGNPNLEIDVACGYRTPFLMSDGIHREFVTSISAHGSGSTACHAKGNRDVLYRGSHPSARLFYEIHNIRAKLLFLNNAGPSTYDDSRGKFSMNDVINNRSPKRMR